MTEILIAPTSEPSPSDTPEVPYSSETIQHLRAEILKAVETRGLRTESVLFAGYQPDAPKHAGDEHVDERGTPLFFFGDELSLLPPSILAGEAGTQEDKEDHWMANPLRYALPTYALGVYDKEALETLSGGAYEEDLLFGTYVYALSPETVETAKLFDIRLDQHTTP